MKKTAAFALILVIVALFTTACGGGTSSIEKELQNEIVEKTTTKTETTTEPTEMWSIDFMEEILIGPSFTCEMDSFSVEIVCYNEDCCILFDYSERDLYKVSVDGNKIKLSEGQKVIDFTVAYDTIYWFNLDREVWSISWAEEDSATLYCEDAIAVSPFTDECEGAVVLPERANWVGYGDLPIYSPYGK